MHKSGNERLFHIANLIAIFKKHLRRSHHKHDFGEFRRLHAETTDINPTRGAKNIRANNGNGQKQSGAYAPKHPKAGAALQRSVIARIHEQSQSRAEHGEYRLLHNVRGSRLAIVDRLNRRCRKHHDNADEHKQNNRDQKAQTRHHDVGGHTAPCAASSIQVREAGRRAGTRRSSHRLQPSGHCCHATQRAA